MSKTDTRLTLEDLEIQRFFWAPSFEVYNGVAGLYDLGPVGCAIERHLLQFWREHFVTEEDMAEVRCSVLTPYKVLEASGHTTKFNDFMVTDTVNNQLYRADQLIEQILEKRMLKEKDETKKEQMMHDHSLAGDMNGEQLAACIAKWEIKSPDGNPLTEPVPFNLMFSTRIGPGARAIAGHLRPETAQGIFVNFPRLYEFHRGELPFAAAQIGTAYRNEIAPRNGLVRCREFQMAEIEHFADPEHLDDVEKFDDVADLEIALYNQHRQEEESGAEVMTLRAAIENHIIPHKTMAYFIGRTYLFLVAIGIIPEKIRFRQHRANEKAHYSRDCWDAEVLLSIGWLECVGIADRQAFDLTQHSKATAGSNESQNSQMFAQVPLAEPIVVKKATLVPNKAILGKALGKKSAEVFKAVAQLPEEEAEVIAKNYEAAEKLIGGKPNKKNVSKVISGLEGETKAEFEKLTKVTIGGFEFTYETLSASIEDVTQTVRTFIPNVIEPSFGVGRIMTALLEHSFYVRQEEGRRVLKLSPFIAPYKCTVLPLGAKLIPAQMVKDLRTMLRKANIAHQTDASGASIGKRYARSDELGTPFAITLDLETVQNGTVTLRERDSMKQVRCTMQQAVAAIVAMSARIQTWEEVTSLYPAFTATSSE